MTESLPTEVPIGRSGLAHFPDSVDYERLLTREGRAALPLARLLMLYLDPFALFMDASRGPASLRERALSHNRAQRPILLTYLRRWIVIAVGS